MRVIKAVCVTAVLSFLSPRHRFPLTSLNLRAYVAFLSRGGDAQQCAGARGSRAYQLTRLAPVEQFFTIVPLSARLLTFTYTRPSDTTAAS